MILRIVWKIKCFERYRVLGRSFYKEMHGILDYYHIVEK